MTTQPATIPRDFPVEPVFPVGIPEGFSPGRALTRDSGNITCSGYDPGDDYKPRWGGGFFQARDAGQHAALDIMAAEGALVRAVDDGTVKRTVRMGGQTYPGAGSSPNGGYYVWIDHPWGTSYYSHLRDMPKVRPGQVVRKGETLGFVGRTGNASVGCPHLHIALANLGGQKFDPKEALEYVYNQGDWAKDYERKFSVLGLGVGALAGVFGVAVAAYFLARPLLRRR